MEGHRRDIGSWQCRVGVTIELQGEGAVGGNKLQHLSQSGSVAWDVTIKDSATVILTRLDAHGCSRAILASPNSAETGA